MRWLWSRPLYPQRCSPPPSTPASARVLALWYLAATAVGLAFGLYATRGGGSTLGSNALIRLFGIGCVLLVGLRLVLRRPLTEIFTERQLVAGCGFALAAFVAGNWLVTHGATLPLVVR